MQFIEMTGKQLLELITDGELTEAELKSAGVSSQTIVRINQQGHIEIRRAAGWDVVGGLIGEFETRIKQTTGLEWA
jgi:hypothetical protein